MASNKEIKAGLSKQAVLDDILENNQKRVGNAIRSLESRVLAGLKVLDTSAGVLVSTEANLASAVQLRTELLTIFEDEFLTKYASEVMGDIDKLMISTKTYLESVGIDSFVGADLAVIEELKSGVFVKMEQIAGDFQSVLADGIYNNVLTGGNYTNLIDEVRNSLTGIADLAGRPMAVHTETIVNTAIGTVDRAVSLKKADDAGTDKLLYSGTLVKGSRDHCQQYVGVTKTTSEWEDIWSGNWQGKSGSSLADGGGWNCGHTFLAVVG